LTNFALVGLTSIPIELWGDQAATTAEVLEEYAAGVDALKLPRENWMYHKIINLSSDEQVLGIRMFSKLAMGERSCLAVSMVRGAMLATDEQLVRRAAENQGIRRGIRISRLQPVMIEDPKKRNNVRRSYSKYLMWSIYPG
jgi:predicted nucleic acid-binding protein